MPSPPLRRRRSGVRARPLYVAGRGGFFFCFGGFFCILAYLILATALSCPHFMYKKIVVQRDQVTCLRRSTRTSGSRGWRAGVQVAAGFGIAKAPARQAENKTEKRPGPASGSGCPRLLCAPPPRYPQSAKRVDPPPRATVSLRRPGLQTSLSTVTVRHVTRWEPLFCSTVQLSNRNKIYQEMDSVFLDFARHWLGWTNLTYLMLFSVFLSSCAVNVYVHRVNLSLVAGSSTRMSRAPGSHVYDKGGRDRGDTS